MTPPGFCGTIRSYEVRSPRRGRVAIARQSRRRRAGASRGSAAGRATSSTRRPKRTRSSCSAIASRSATTRTARSRPTSARWSSIRRRRTFRRELAGLYLRQSKVQEAMSAAEAGAEDRAGQSRSEPRARHRLRRAVGERSQRRRRAAAAADRPTPRTSRRRFAISRRRSSGRCREADPNVRATLARALRARRGSTTRRFRC